MESLLAIVRKLIVHEIDVSVEWQAYHAVTNVNARLGIVKTLCHTLHLLMNKHVW